MKAIDELKQLLKDFEDDFKESGYDPPISAEFSCESSLIYQLIKEWPTPELAAAKEMMRQDAMEALNIVYAYLSDS